jgi:hypothetical protein
MPHGQDTVRSRTIRSDAQQADNKRVGVGPSSRYNFELAAALYDEWMRGAIRSDSDWSTAVNISGTDIAAASSGNQYTSTVVDISANVNIGQWVYVAGFTTAANNGWRKVTAASTYALTVSGGTLVDEAAGDSVTIKGAYIRNGSTLHAYSLQEAYEDLTNKFRLMTGGRINQFGLEQAEGSIINGSIAFDGKQRAQAAAAGGNGTITAAASKDVVTEVDGFESVWIDASVITTDVFALSLNVAVGTRPRKALGSLTRTEMKLNAPVITGGISMYMDDDTWTYDGDYEGFTKFALAFSLDMQGGDRYHFECPQVVFTDEAGETPGQDSDNMLDFTWEADPGGTFDSPAVERMIQVCRVQA